MKLSHLLEHDPFEEIPVEDDHMPEWERKWIEEDDDMTAEDEYNYWVNMQKRKLEERDRLLGALKHNSRYVIFVTLNTMNLTPYADWTVFQDNNVGAKKVKMLVAPKAPKSIVWMASRLIHAIEYEHTIRTKYIPEAGAKWQAEQS